MSDVIVRNTLSLQGSVKISASKNAALPILAASVLTGAESEIPGAPELVDVKNMLALLEGVGCRVIKQERRVIIDSSCVSTTDITGNCAQKLRASFLLAGPMLSRFGEAVISFPGGCDIGARPVDLHINAFKQMGASVSIHGNQVRLKGALRGCKTYLQFPSVGATENIMTAACLASGQTIIQNAATEPEISDLAGFLRSAGAKIAGDGTGTISIEGVKTMRKTVYSPIPDRIEAGTFMIACAATGGDLLLYNTRCEQLDALIKKLTRCGAEIKKYPSSLRITCRKRLNGADITTLPYPGFPTDLLPQMMAFCCVSQGISVLTETIFENRFRHTEQLCRLGADISTRGRTAMIKGRRYLIGGDVYATDLRAGAAMIIAGLSAQGQTVIHDCEHIDRGYDGIEEKLCGLGAVITRGRQIIVDEPALVADSALTHA